MSGAMRAIRGRRVRFEQAVYGTFPFWHRGYALLAKSRGCKDEWLHKLREACQRYGEPPGGLAAGAIGGHFALRMSDGAWMIVRAYSPGDDDRGRPGAMAFHAAFVAAHDYRRLNSPLDLAPSLRSDWGPESIDAELPPGVATITRPPDGAMPEASRAARALTRGQKVLVESPEPIDALVRSTWRLLPGRTRRRAGLATRAYGLANGFDLMAVPRRPSGSESYADLAALPVAPPPLRPTRTLAIGGGTLAALALIALIWAIWPERAETPTEPTVPGLSLEPPPSRPAGGPTADDRANGRVAEAVVSFGDECQVDFPPAPTASEAMRTLSTELRHPGPWLSAAEIEELGAPAADWHRHMIQFASDRPLPEDFDSGPLAWQVETLGWSFHQDDERDRTIDGVLARLRRPWPVEAHPKRDRSPALAAYEAFLARLPRARGNP